MSGTLYIVATPIGHLGDISDRAAETLASVDFIAAEDTRVTVKLLNHLEIKKPMLPYHRHNHVTAGADIVRRLCAGENCALVSDAGTPAVSDPGEDLVQLCVEADIPVTSIPGSCALVTGLVLSGLPTGRFTFEGFLAMNKKNRRAHLLSLREEARTMIFYEAPHKLRSTLGDLRDTFGGSRKIALCRELTKLHEEVRRVTLDEAVDWYAQNPPRGEFVLVVAGAAPPPPDKDALWEDARGEVTRRQGAGMTLRDAVRTVAEEYKISRKTLYNMQIAEKDEPARFSNYSEEI
jgi:16S rRNA (cytidine1402-2'-O)-methyltransferase